jgi:cbb3-type cytochrome oxidase cytochrome c subunit
VADPGQRYYLGNTLSKWFALASLALFGSLIYVVYHDYAREWKRFQREFRKLEITKSQEQRERSKLVLQNNAPYQELLKKIDTVQKTFDSKKNELASAQKSLDEIQKRNSKKTQEFQFAKADFEACKYRYEAARNQNRANTRTLKTELDRLEVLKEKLRLEMEASEVELKKHMHSVSVFFEDRKKLEKEKAAIAKDLDLIERNLLSMDPDSMSFANKVADKIRDLPVIDYMNPYYRIKQTVVSGITEDVNFMRVQKVDRCETCHLGTQKPEFANEKNPFKTHPNLDLFLSSDSPHPAEEFACTTCHEGRGRGTDFVSTAHTPSNEEQKKEWEKNHHWHLLHHWDKPMLPKQYMEAGCFKCHSNESTLQGAEKLTLGLRLIEQAGCYSCHKIEKFKAMSKRGPSLKHLTSKLSPEWTYRWIQDPASFRKDTWMPSFFNQSNNSDPESKKRGEQEIHAMVSFLFAKSTEISSENPILTGDAKKGEAWVSSVGCLACHRMDGNAEKTPSSNQSLRNQFGPNLSGLGSKSTHDWIVPWLQNPSHYDPETKMPRMKITDQEAADISVYLTQNQKPSFLQTPIPPVDLKIVDNIALDFLKKSVTEQEAKEQISTMKLEEKLIFSGKKLVQNYGCYSCHSIEGMDSIEPIGAELTEIGSKTTHQLDFGFVKIPHTPWDWFTHKLKDPRSFDAGQDKDSLDKLRMPNFNFTDTEIDAIVTALLGFVKPDPGNTKMRARTEDILALEEGQKLVRQFNCQSCHAIEGDGGQIQSTVTSYLMQHKAMAAKEAESMTPSFSPPNLIGEGKKVQSEWLYHFLENPSIIRPWLSVRMPQFSMTEKQRNALVRYFSILDQEAFPFVNSVDTTLTLKEWDAAQQLVSKDIFDCFTCHIQGDKLPAGSPDRFAPDLTLAAKRLKPNWVMEWIKQPNTLLPGTKMPTYFDASAFNDSGPEDILNGDENEQIRVMRNYLFNLDKEPKKEEK